MTDPSSIESWFAGRLPDEWTADDEPAITIDREEIMIIVTIAPPELDPDASEADLAEAVAGRVSGFREDTRDRRMQIAREAEHRFDRKVAWAVRVGDHTALFTHLAAPVIDAPPPARASGPRHPRRRQHRPLTFGRARLVRPPGRAQRRRMAHRATRGDAGRRRGPRQGPRDRLARLSRRGAGSSVAASRRSSPPPLWSRVESRRRRRCPAARPCRHPHTGLGHCR